MKLYMVFKKHPMTEKTELLYETNDREQAIQHIKKEPDYTAWNYYLFRRQGYMSKADKKE